MDSGVPSLPSIAPPCDLVLRSIPRKQGHAEATFYLAQAYRSGSPEMGLPQDLRVFGELLQQAASAGSSDALFALGGAFFHGEDGFARDPRAAFRCVCVCVCESCLEIIFFFLSLSSQCLRNGSVLASITGVVHWAASFCRRDE